MNMKNDIFENLFHLVNFLNAPENDADLLKLAGIDPKKDKHLLPVIVRVGMQPSLTVGQLAEQLGRDHSSVSRQIAKFEGLSLIGTRPSRQDKRVRELSLTKSGQAIFERIEKARSDKMNTLFSELSESQLAQISDSIRLLNQLIS
ncbi:MarR family winged helix-turn-helix transcriptional regulator [Lactococcus insecticola]|nr:MarR family transcriptional regulator [Lactococcus insecticola]